ncbi:hypothetical protein M405DRAFT_816662 [Rhizopogon salebrosus TDB-379]|nr:hypothetical protein M405DRAFT_816662 [Rhizopogon salebrosus TDB-379]
MVQLASRFAAFLAFCFLASATPIYPLYPFLSLSPGVVQPIPHLHTVVRAVPVSVFVDVRKDNHERQNPVYCPTLPNLSCC